MTFRPMEDGRKLRVNSHAGQTMGLGLRLRAGFLSADQLRTIGIRVATNQMLVRNRNNEQSLALAAIVCPTFRPPFGTGDRERLHQLATHSHGDRSVFRQVIPG